MEIITSFTMKKLEKQLAYERNVLKDVSYVDVCARIGNNT